MARTLALDIAIYALLCLFTTVLTSPLPTRWFDRDSWLFRGRPWERGGSFYQTFFRVRIWKTRLPELADFFKSLFPKKSVRSFDAGYVARYLQESRKAEFTHWCIIASPVVFLAFGKPWGFALVVVLAALTNLPFIIIQRYNRPRLEEAMRRRSDAASEPRRAVRSS